METKKILIPIVALLVGLALGFAFGYPAGQQQAKQLAEAELQQLREIVEEFWPVEPEMFSVGGQILEVKASSLLVETLSVHPLEELPTVREILAADDTVIVKRTEKDPEIYEREMEEYMRLEEKIMSQAEAGIEPEDWPEFPEYYLETEISLNQIEPGNRIRAEAGQDIKWAENFTAAKITVEF